MVAGRLYVTCNHVTNIRRKDQTETKTRLCPFLSLTLAPDSLHSTTLKTDIQHRFRSTNDPNFTDVIIFDIKSHIKLQGGGGGIKLLIQLFDRSDLGEDDLLGEAELSVFKYFTSLQSCSCTEVISLVEPGDVSSNSNVELNIQFRPVMVGMLVVTLLECRDLKNVEINRPPGSATLEIGVGNVVDRCDMECDDNGCTNCGGKEVCLHIDEANWFNEMSMKLYERSTNNTVELGMEKVSFISQMADPSNAEKKTMTVRMMSGHREGNSTKVVGEVNFILTFLHGGKLLAKVMSGQNLRHVDDFKRIHPYVKMTVRGKANEESKSTRCSQDGGDNPTWEDDLSFTVTDHHQIDIECFDQGNVSKSITHDLVGRAEISLLPIFDNKHMEKWVHLSYRDEFGEVVDAGRIFVIFDINGPSGVQFPIQSSTASNEDANGSMQSVESNNNGQEVMTSGDISEMTTTQMQSIFNFLDLDKNGFIGAAEIKHILICMGELITDDEVDMMIAMLDCHGNGQVNMQQLYRLVQSPDPSMEDFGS